jgi:lysine/ornithine N-monooxygenase
MSSPLDAVVIGAGPYGVASAAALQRAGVQVRVFGSLMSFWKEHMPKGMCLRSPYEASHIGAPSSDLCLAAYERTHGRLARPVPVADFVAYGEWVAQQAALNIDPRHVDRVVRAGDGFSVVLEDGEPVLSRRVVVAAGISPFGARPEVFRGVSPDFASHSSEHGDLGRFAGRRVAVVGGGQSAIESAVLLRENGADVEVLMRAHHLSWVGRAPREGLIGKLLFDRTDVGPMLFSHLIAHPTLMRRLPVWVRRDASRRALAPGASLWLRERLRGLEITSGRHVVRVAQGNGHLQLVLDDGTSRDVDHALLATGYRVDVRGYRFLAPLREAIRRVDGFPLLDAGFQSSVPGLHFVGAPGMHSFGPLVRFVAGTDYTGRALVRAATGQIEKRGSVADRAVDVHQATQQLQ